MTNPVYNKARRRLQLLVKRIPIFGFKAFNAAKRLEESLKNLFVPGALFEELGFRYFGPINGHNIEEMITTFRNLSKLREPIIVHVVTKKGKGYKYAEENPSVFHGAAPFNVENGKPTTLKKNKGFTEVFSEAITKMARKDEKIVAITAAMPDGTGLSEFSKEFPNRFFDVGIAEQHAITFSAGLARQGFKPVVAIYSTFLQRGYDQMINDISLQGVAVVFCIDRAGIVGEDGPTHHGVFDMAYLRQIPNFTVMAPRDGFELEAMLDFAVSSNKPMAIRYPKKKALSEFPKAPFQKIEMGKSEILRNGKDLVIFAIGSMVSTAAQAADSLSSGGIEATVVNARFIKPLDKETILNITERIKKVVTIEEGVLTGGFGSAVLEFLEMEKVKELKIKRIGLPNHFISHGKREELLREYHLSGDEVCKTIKEELFEKVKWLK